MIRFKKIRWRNFLSTGNAWSEVDLDNASTTLIVGDNGAGKSTILDAITFVLFGKPFRNINKPQLINSVNQKQLVVEVEFVLGKKEYKIIRGIKPNIFEIYCNDELLNQDASVKDYQQILEDQILKLNYRSFKQVVILGSASFTPFMQLPTGARREIVEDLLDIGIFSSMNRVLKDRFNALSAELMNLNSEIEVAKQKTMIRKKYIDGLKEDKQEKIKDYIASIEETQRNITNHQNEIALLQKAYDKERDSILDARLNADNMVEFENNLRAAEKALKNLDEEIGFYLQTEECPKCQQNITEDHKHKTMKELRVDRDLVESEIKVINASLTQARLRFKEVRVVEEKLVAINNVISQHNIEIQAGQQYVDKIQRSIAELEAKNDNIEDEKRILQQESQDVVDKLTRRSELNEERQYHNVASALLKDTGIKTKIINQYLPIINKLVNKYLSAMDLFIQFELDEAFNETIKSRYRDEFTYASFSEGEKQRINLALLFAWRSVASIRNTTNTNLLLFDEVLDGSLDATAVEYFLSLVKDIAQNSNIFVITHKQDLFVDKFDRVIKASKVGGYSVIAEVEK